jgi:hypothetical protein
LQPAAQQAPDHRKTEPLAGVAVSVTLDVAYAWEHVEPPTDAGRTRADGADPFPEVATVRVWVGA